MRDLLQHKLTMPIMDEDAIVRTKLQLKLKSIKNSEVTVMTAGAGYGKTTAIVQYLKEETSPVGWYSLGPEDDNLYFFSIYLATALNSIFPGLKEWYGEKIEQAEKREWKSLYFEFMVGIEKFSTADTAGFLVIDDWQCVQNESDITMFFDRLLSTLPGGVRTIILSREYVTLPFVEKLRMKGEVADFFPGDFLFDSYEIKSFFLLMQIPDISERSIKEVLNQTEGWVMLIKLLITQWKQDEGLLTTYLTSGNFHSDVFLNI